MDKNLNTFVAGIALLACVPAGAQNAVAVSATAVPVTRSIPASRAIDRFEAITGASVIIANGIDLTQSVPIPHGIYHNPADFIQNVAGAVGADYRKIWIVSPSDGNSRPVTDAASLVHAVSVSEVTLAVGTISAADAIRTVASADNADVRFIGNAPSGTVRINETDMGIANAIAAIAAQTHTNWALSYRLTPTVLAQTDSSMAVRRMHMNLQNNDRAALASLYAPLTIHFPNRTLGPDPNVMAQLYGSSATNLIAPSISESTPVDPGVVETGGYGYGYGSSGYGGAAIIGGTTTSSISPSGTTITTPSVPIQTTAPVVAPAAPSQTTVTTTSPGTTTVTTSP